MIDNDYNYIIYFSYYRGVYCRHSPPLPPTAPSSVSPPPAPAPSPPPASPSSLLLPLHVHVFSAGLRMFMIQSWIMIVPVVVLSGFVHTCATSFVVEMSPRFNTTSNWAALGVGQSQEPQTMVDEDAVLKLLPYSIIPRLFPHV